MRAHTCKRFGWNTPNHLLEELDKKYFDKIEIKPIIARLVEIDPADVNAPIPADREPQAVEARPPELSTGGVSKGRTGAAR
jgi:hypothetical protein